MASPANGTSPDTDPAAASASPRDGDRGAARAPCGGPNPRPATTDPARTRRLGGRRSAPPRTITPAPGGDPSCVTLHAARHYSASRPAMPSEDASAPPFFIVGNDRSGTTMLRLILDRSAVAIPPESMFLVDFEPVRQAGGLGNPEKAASFMRRVWEHPRVRVWGIAGDPPAVPLGLSHEEAYRFAVEAPFRAYAEMNEKERWADKTPLYLAHVGELAEIWPEARFVVSRSRRTRRRAVAPRRSVRAEQRLVGRAVLGARNRSRHGGRGAVRRPRAHRPLRRHRREPPDRGETALRVPRTRVRAGPARDRAHRLRQGAERSGELVHERLGRDQLLSGRKMAQGDVTRRPEGVRPDRRSSSSSAWGTSEPRPKASRHGRLPPATGRTTLR